MANTLLARTGWMKLCLPEPNPACRLIYMAAADTIGESATFGAAVLAAPTRRGKGPASARQETLRDTLHSNSHAWDAAAPFNPSVSAMPRPTTDPIRPSGRGAADTLF